MWAVQYLPNRSSSRLSRSESARSRSVDDLMKVRFVSALGRSEYYLIVAHSLDIVGM